MPKVETFRNRIAEIRTVTAAELRANPLNWRRHPQRQADALRGVLSEVGIAAPLIAYHSPQADNALTLIDGHMRLTTGGSWPCAILDVDDAEARLLLATFDPISALAETDASALDALLRDVQTGDAAVMAMLAQMATDVGITPPDFAPVSADEQPRLDQKAPVTCPHCGAEFVPK